MEQHNIYDMALPQNKANFIALTPLQFIERTAQIYPDRTSVIHGDKQFTWKQTYARCRQLASALQKKGIVRGQTVAVLANNTPEHIEAHYGIPMCGAVITSLNTRLDAALIAFQLIHSEAKVLIVDRQYSAQVQEALEMLDKAPLIIDIDDPEYKGGTLLGDADYEAFIATGDPEFDWYWPNDEWDAISMNYTSGTTGDPKGVVYHHRGAFLNSMGNAVAWNMQHHPVYLWTLPMFHASGWCFHWTITAMAGTHICLRKVEAAPIFDLIKTHHVTYFTAAPIVLNMLVNAPPEVKKRFDYTVKVMTAGSAPPAAVLEAMATMGFDVTHVYGATEVFGPNMSCAWHPEWSALEDEEQAYLKARQGVRTQFLEKMIVGKTDTCEEVPWDGLTMGEVLMRGNTVMKGYLKNPKTTAKTFSGGWYHTGDLAVRHPDGYIEVKDRLKDIIISGAENISTIEVESVIYRHPAVLEAAVVAKPDDKWGEVPCAFIELKPNAALSEDEMITYCRDKMAHYKAPKYVVFGALDKTSTGKIQKYVLREKAKHVPIRKTE
ncbi:MAG: acyl-CoA synthetase [Alphaproteobacteria bacterium]|nr:acyl-CoA synthetase [Alphaproteobacteria bacterium]